MDERDIDIDIIRNITEPSGTEMAFQEVHGSIQLCIITLYILDKSISAVWLLW